ncbi:MAG: hypothetical protein MUC93_03560 [Bacteroidales bacterium]|jgi:spermidine synthase|nr:hypothetical protein [Bacteroidales bacterium]
MGFFSQAFHKKLWNSALAILFLFTATAGVLMALQINFKWNIPIVKYILKWHVEAGAGLAITGIFHFIWHLSYFGKIFSKTETLTKPAESAGFDSSVIISNLFVLGFTSISVQILLMREIMNISGGYELITGLFLGSWLIASAGGAALAARSPLNDIPKINMIFSLSPAISLMLLIIISRLFLKTGEIPSFLSTTIITFLILVPFCLISGFAFVKVITSAGEKNGFIPGKSFSIETTGGIIAGILVSVLTAGLLDTYLLLLIVTSLTIAFSILTFFVKNRRSKLIVKCSFAAIISIIILSGPDRIFRQLLLPGIKVIETTDTPYGNITRGEYSGEQSIYYNQRLIGYNDDAIEREEDIHYALLQRNNIGSIVLISGSLESHLPEILKYPVKKITFIERDPVLARLPVSKEALESTSLIIENKDAFSYVRNKKDHADAVILLLPPPSTLSLNRFYTTEFFNDIKKLLSNGGIFMCSPGPGENYLNKEAVYLYSSVYNSLAEVFRFVKPVTGNKLYFLASDKELSVSFCKLADEKGIKNIYVSSDFLADDLIEKKSAEVAYILDPNVRVNRLAFPVACLYFQNYDFSKNLGEKIPALIIIILAFAVPVLSVRRRDVLMYFSASALAGFEFIILLTVQLTVGNMYQFVGIILAALMAGLAAGAGLNQKFLNSISLKLKAFFILIFYAVISISYNYMTDLKGVVTIILLIIISVLIPSFMTGHLFRVLTEPENNGTSPGMTYSADLAGSAMGFILVTSVTVPLLGIRVSIFLLAVLILTGILFGTNRNKH